MIRVTFSLVFALLGAAAFAAATWLEDFEAAKKASAATGKPILVDVTGSDWCPPCQQMEAEVFHQPEFQQTVATQFVLLRLDFPRQKSQSERTKTQNRLLAERYPFEGFPTWFLLDAQGTLFGRHSGYLPGGVAAFRDMVTGLNGQKATLTALVDASKKAAPGVARAQAYDALFRQAEAWGLEFQYGDLPQKIILEDSAGTVGLKGWYQTYNAYQRLLSTWTERSDFQTAIKDLDQLATRALAWPELRQRILFTKGMVWLNALGDEFQARAAFWQARGLGSDTPTGRRIEALLDQLP